MRRGGKAEKKMVIVRRERESCIALRRPYPANVWCSVTRENSSIAQAHTVSWATASVFLGFNCQQSRVELTPLSPQRSPTCTATATAASGAQSACRLPFSFSREYSRLPVHTLLSLSSLQYSVCTLCVCVCAALASSLLIWQMKLDLGLHDTATNSSARSSRSSRRTLFSLTLSLSVAFANSLFGAFFS